MLEILSRKIFIPSFSTDATDAIDSTFATAETVATVATDATIAVDIYIFIFQLAQSKC